jgi:nucleotide-binding universal stress UspA family protein
MPGRFPLDGDASLNILLAVDGSPCSNLAVAEVGRLPWPVGTNVRVATVDAPATTSSLSGSPTVYDELVRQQREEAVRRVNSAVSQLREIAPGLVVLPRVLEGDPKEAIIAEAEEWKADLIVVGSNGYGPIQRFFLGSVSQHVACNAPCSVLIVRCTPDNCPVPGMQGNR